MESITCRSGGKSDVVAKNILRFANRNSSSLYDSALGLTDAIFKSKTKSSTCSLSEKRLIYAAAIGDHEAVLEQMAQYADSKEEPQIQHGTALINIDSFDGAHAALLELISHWKPKTWWGELAEQLMLRDQLDSKSPQSLPLLMSPDRTLPLQNIDMEAQSSLSSGKQPFQLNYCRTVGWHLVANRDIFPGELIACEIPYVQILMPGRVLENCYYCLKPSISLIPCRRCSEVGFCSAHCEEAAWTSDWCTRDVIGSTDEKSSGNLNQFHRFECGQRGRISLTDIGGLYWLKSVISATTVTPQFLQRYRSWSLDVQPLDHETLDVHSVHLAFACVARTHWREIWSLAKNFQDETTAIGTDISRPLEKLSPLFAFSGREQMPQTKLDGGSFVTVGWRRNDSQTRSTDDLWQRTVAAVFLAHCLSAGGYPLDFSNHPLMDPSSKHALDGDCILPASWAAACLLYQLQTVTRSIHTTSDIWYEQQTSETNTTATDWDRIEMTPICEGIQPILSLVQHSCQPNAASISTSGHTQALFALATIPTGTMILRNKWETCHSRSTCERRLLLHKRFGVLCRCIVCRENWPDGSVMENMLRCRRCRNLMLIDGTTLSVRSGSSVCRCPFWSRPPLLLGSRQRYNMLEEARSTDLETVRNIPFHQISSADLDSCIIAVVNRIEDYEKKDLAFIPSDVAGCHGELLYQLLCLRYRQSYTISSVLSKPKPSQIYIRFR